MIKQNCTHVKQMIQQFKLVLNRGGTAESIVNETEYNMKIAAAHAGIAWERLNIEEIKKQHKWQAKKDAKLNKN